VLGVGIHPINIPLALAAVDRWISRREPHYVCLTPIHAAYDAYCDPDLKRILNRSGLTAPDGMGIVWLLRLRGNHGVQRVYGPDLVVSLCEHGIARGYRHYFYGGETDVAKQLAERLTERFPGLAVAGAVSPPFGALTAGEDAAMVERINQSHPDIVWVGLGTGKQERWMADHQAQLEAPVLIAVGAAFDFLSGRKPQAPPWMRRSGLEWLFRLGSEPRRLWPRYREYPRFLVLVLAQSLGLRRFTLD
jgi:N-acetylglucosaminyldiphosphoundecaprenol N-acetyl-beta-D-mannosaminyltransferase